MWYAASRKSIDIKEPLTGAGNFTIRLYSASIGKALEHNHCEIANLIDKAVEKLGELLDKYSKSRIIKWVDEAIRKLGDSLNKPDEEACG